MKNLSHPSKQTLKQFKDTLCQAFNNKTSIITLTQELVDYIDSLLCDLFDKNKLHEGNHFCLLALGGYGRRELQLHSDVDLLLLHTDDLSDSYLHPAQSFIQDCWDVGLAVSHQITTVSACAELASQDVSVISTLLDMHFLAGNQALMEELRYQTHPLHMWPSQAYFFAKQKEQQARHNKYGETAYNLEPNVKNGPGGLRDLQILLNVGKRHFGIKQLAEGTHYGFITEKENKILITCQHFLWRVRFGLHMLAGKQEERLLFDYQLKLASLFDYHNTAHSLALEQFMKTYFKVIKRTRELNEMLLQWFSEVIVHHEQQKIIPLDAHFQLANNFIEVKHNKIFSQKPITLLKLFLWLAKRPTISGIRANTIRLIRQNLHLMGKKFRSSAETIECFLAIFKTCDDPYNALHHMNKHGVLARYLACFSAVTGQMQYDLFHVYTVDQHTLFVIRNLGRFLQPSYEKQFSLASKLMKKIENRAILYLAALFHDIAKGRGGDHSEIGAEEALAFAHHHLLQEDECNLLVWLVRHHLLMSQTAQRQDIYDPATIRHFCLLLPNTNYLDYLYLLTVADICATNQALWNSWKDSLLKELYRAALQQQQALITETALIEARKETALKILFSQGITQEEIEPLWRHFKNKYFLHEDPSIIASHTKAILNCTQFPLVLILPHHSQSSTEVFIYMPHRDDRFTITTTVLSNQQVTIQEATILTCNNQFDMDTYIILDEYHQPLVSTHRIQTIQHALTLALAKMDTIPLIAKRRLSRRQAHFNVEPSISFDEKHESQYSCLFLVTIDRPGLLASVSNVFSQRHIYLHNAKIATAGEKAEDMFYISNQYGHPLDKKEKDLLKELLIKKLTL